MRVRVHIERLVLAQLDLPAGERAALCDTVGAELRALLGSGGVGRLRAGGRFAVLPGPDIPSAGPDPVRLGRQIAHAAYDGLTSAGERRR